MPDIEYEAGAFHAYRATAVINVGAIDTAVGGYNVAKDEVFRYDGDTIILKDAREFSGIPQMRGAIDEGWFVPASDTKSIFRPKTTTIQVTAAEQRGYDRAPKMSVIVEQSEEATVGTVDDRTRDREAKHAAVSAGLPVFNSPEAKAVVLAHVEEVKNYEFDCGDEEMNAIAVEISIKCAMYWQQELSEMIGDEGFETEPEDIGKTIETDMLSMFSRLDDMDDPPSQHRSKKVAKKRANKQTSKFPVQAEERLSMPLQNGDDQTENSGKVVGTVKTRIGTVIEEEKTIEMKVAPATPQSGKTSTPRLGVSGAIVVAEDQKDVGEIKLSKGAKGSVSMDETAKVKPATTDSVRLAAEAQVGGHAKMAMEVVEGDSGGVPVGRVKSPAVQDFVATDSNTSSSAIDRTEKGKQLNMEHTGKAPSPVATGDVQEARSGEELDELLPDAATTPTPKVYLRPEEDPAYQAIKMLIPDFDWDKDRRWQDRVEDAMKYIQNPPYLKGILAVETETVKLEIKKRLAQVLEAKKAAR